MTSRYSAPGKLVLCGEYAVLDGHPAVVAAVDVRAVATRSRADRIFLQGNGARAFDLSRERDDARRLVPLLVAVHDEIERRGLAMAPGRIVVDTSAFFIDGHKLGLGSSAACAVACAAALLDSVVPDDVHAVARAAHRAFQGGGSGIDVAASCYGGVLRFAKDAPPRATSPIPRDVAAFVVDTGVAQSTQGFVDRYRALADRERHANALGFAARAFLDAEHAGALFAAVQRARDAMKIMGEAAGIDVVSAVHQRVAELASRCGGAAKPSGAGGGDVAVAFVPAHRHDEFRTEISRAGLRLVDVTLGAVGVRRDG